MYPQNGTFMEPPRNCPWLPAHFFRCRGVDHLTGDPKSQAALLYQSGKTQAPAFFSASDRKGMMGSNMTWKRMGMGQYL